MSTSHEKLDQLSSSARISLGDSKTIFILFVDLCNSTDFKKYCRDNDIPDGIWIERQLIFLYRVMKTIKRYGGTVVKTIGDEVMAYFESSSNAESILKCATDTHSIFRDIKKYDKGIWKIEAKLSLDYGEVYDSNLQLLQEEVWDPVGIVVDRCARLNGKCKPSQVIFSSSFFSLLESNIQEDYAKYKEEDDLKGIGKSEFYRLIIS